MGNEPLAGLDLIERAIHVIRGQKVMLDWDLARFYGVSTRRLNEQFRRNRRRFPDDFAFQLVREEFMDLMSQIATSNKGRGGTRKLPWWRQIGFHVKDEASNTISRTRT